MQANGADQVTQVRGFADQCLRKLDNSLAPSNRRVSLIVQYTPRNADNENAKPSAGGKEKASGDKSSTSPSENSPKKE